MCFELAQLITNWFGDAAKVVDEVHGFRSFDERDLLGYVDVTGLKPLKIVTVDI